MKSPEIMDNTNKATLSDADGVADKNEEDCIGMKEYENWDNVELPFPFRKA